MRMIFEPLAHHLDIGTAGDRGAGDMIEIPTRAFEAKLMLPKGSAIKLVKPGRIRINNVANARGFLVVMRRHRGDQSGLIDCEPGANGAVVALGCFNG